MMVVSAVAKIGCLVKVWFDCDEDTATIGKWYDPEVPHDAGPDGEGWSMGSLSVSLLCRGVIIDSLLVTNDWVTPYVDNVHPSLVAETSLYWPCIYMALNIVP